MGRQGRCPTNCGISRCKLYILPCTNISHEYRWNSCHQMAYFKAKGTKFDFGWSSARDSAGKAYRALPDSIAGFQGPIATSNGKGREGREHRIGKGRAGRRGEGIIIIIINNNNNNTKVLKLLLAPWVNCLFMSFRCICVFRFHGACALFKCMNEWMDGFFLSESYNRAANVLEYHHYSVTFWYGIWGNFVPTPLSAAELSSVSDSKLWCKCHFQVWWHLTPDLSISYQLRLNLGEKDEGEGRGREWDAPFTQIRGSAYGPPDLILSALDHWVT